MVNIIINDKTCQLSGAIDQKVLSQLDFELSFKVDGSEYMKLFKLGKWDGRKYLLDNQLNFPYGLFNRVCNILNKNNVQFNIINNKHKSLIVPPHDINNILKSLNKTPYDYQIDVANKVINHDCGIIRIATGGGKTIIMALITASLNKSTIIYVIGLDLLYQVYNLFSSIFGKDCVGIVGDGICDIKDITIISVWTAGVAFGLKKGDIADDSLDDEKKLDASKYAKLKEAIRTAKVAILDECHVAKANTISVINENMNAEYFFGTSASPWRNEDSDTLTEAILGPMIVDISASELIEKGYLVQPLIKFIEVPKMSFSKMTRYQTIYKEYIIENPYRNGLVVGNTVSLVDKGYHVLVLYNYINHGEYLYNEIKKQIPCSLLSGKDSADVRNKAKDELYDGKSKCIISSNIFDIGLDVPILSGLVLAGSGKSPIRALQRVGRVIRKYNLNKKQAAVVDFYDNCKYLLNHSKSRYKMYKTENKFVVSWPKIKK